ncbi:XAC2610-related protein [Flavobacterium sp. RHBU_3]|uniref:XAC2610-related protein n=1 Tax=Flavobacterium sp. RHBU_3 TaxID=3391184 RepID=UPI003984B925
MLKNTIIAILLTLIVCGCQKAKPLSKAEQYFSDKMLAEKLSDDFTDTSDFGYIRIGKFLNKNKQQALVIHTDSITDLSVYELKDDEWIKTYNQQHTDFLRPDLVYIADYNFDGINDIGVVNMVSNGTAIMSFSLWLNKGSTFKYIPEFEEIGTPMLLTKHNAIQGYTACCAFESMNIGNYKWEKDSLIKTSEYAIEDYPYGKTVTLTKDGKETKLPAYTKKDINAVIEHYAQNWKLVDTVSRNRFLY